MQMDEMDDASTSSASYFLGQKQGEAWKTQQATSTSGISSKRNSRPTSAAWAGSRARLAAPATMSTKSSANPHLTAICCFAFHSPCISISSNTIRQSSNRVWRGALAKNDFFIGFASYYFFCIFAATTNQNFQSWQQTTHQTYNNSWEKADALKRLSLSLPSYL